MLRILLVISALACGFASVIPEGLLPQLDGRIVGGAAGSINAYPYQVSLQRSGSHFCGGSIYSHNIVITAAHCVDGANAEDIKVRAGSTFTILGGVLVDVAAFKVHQGYSWSSLENDVAILKLSSSLAFGSTISNIALTESPPPHGAPAVVSGWGVTSQGASSLPLLLQYVNVNIVREVVCASALYSYGKNVRPSMICAAADGKDSCQGDSGGPLVSGGVLVGIVSWGYGCAQPDAPGVYSCVAALRPWIVDTASKI